MTDDMRHMEFIGNVRDRDIATLLEKEKTYNGSWKKAGGRSAWFMARRNMDRLLTMMEKQSKAPPGFNLVNVDDTINAIKTSGKLPGSPEAAAAILGHLRDNFVSEDIFAKIEENPGGEDGTVLACIRDLRCYLTLVEAEMVARGVVPVLTNVPRHVEDRVPLRRVPRHVPGTPEDGGQHGSLYPWQLTAEQFNTLFDASQSDRKDAMNVFYKKVTPDVYRLEPIVSHDKIPRFIFEKYEYLGKGIWLLCREDLPADLENSYPRLQTEMNAFEYEQSPAEFRVLYETRHEKWVLCDKYVENWGR